MDIRSRACSVKESYLKEEEKNNISCIIKNKMRIGAFTYFYFRPTC